MEPRHHKLLAEIMLSAGIVLVCAGLILIFALSMNLAGAILMIIGIASGALSIPTFKLLMMMTEAREE